MPSRAFLGLFAGFVAMSAAIQRPVASPDLVVHEWGTFTTVAGHDGRAVDWLPLGGPDDLPCFVEHFDDRAIGRIKGVTGAALNAIPDYATARANLVGRVRMETPVLYFYSPSAARVDVRVDFPRGLMTEWFPKATVAQRMVTTESLRSTSGTTWIRWPDVALAANSSAHFPKGEEPSHYYAARATDALPVRVGAQSEKFLFYRGVANFDVPLTADVLGDDAIRVTNIGAAPLPVVIAFTNRDGKFGYRIERNVVRDVTMPAPKPGVTLDALRRELETVLVSEGLFAREAAAMVETWRDTWFEQGTRIFYVFPQTAVNELLPLTITPPPSKTARVFVGRMDVITPAMRQDVERAFRTSDGNVLASYGRVLGPIADRVLADTRDAGARSRIQKVLNAALATQLRGGTVCP